MRAPALAAGPWPMLGLLLVAGLSLGASWSCGPVAHWSAHCGGEGCVDSCEIYVVGDDQDVDALCVDRVLRGCGEDADCLGGESCQPTPACEGAGLCDPTLASCPEACAGICVADAPAPDLCRDDGDCAGDQRCGAEDTCLRPPECLPGDLCTHVCYGTCEPRPADVPLCTSDDQCAGGRVCNAAEVCLKPPGCDEPGVLCPAVCFGTCVEP